MSPLTVDALRRWLSEIGELAPSDLDALLRSLSARSPASLDASVLEPWVAQRILTPFQARSILRGTAAELVVDDYVLIQERPAGFSRWHRLEARHRPTAHRLFLWRAPQVDPSDLSVSARRERALAIRHPQLDRGYGLRSIDGQTWGATEWPEGPTLARILKEKTHLPWGTAVQLTYQAALGLAHLHAAELVHGRLNPSELIVQPGGHVKLLRDPWDASRGDVEESSHRSAHVWFAGFLAPELALPGQRPDPLTDIYSVGCLLYAMLAGTPPFAADSVADVLARPADGAPPSWESRWGAPDGLNELIAQMLAKSRAQRFSTMAEVLEAMEPYLPSGCRQTVPRVRSTERTFLAEAGVRWTDQAIEAPSVRPRGAEQSAVRTRPTPHRLTSRLRGAWVTLAACGLLALLGGWWWQAAQLPSDTQRSSQRQAGDGRPPQHPASDIVAAQQPAEARSGHPQNRPPEASTSFTLVDDDGTHLWQSPTEGKPFAIAWAPPGAQAFLRIRPQALLRQPAGLACWEVLDPSVHGAVEAFLEPTTLRLAEVDSLLLAWARREDGPPHWMLTITLSSAQRQMLEHQVTEPQSGPQGIVGRIGAWAILLPPTSLQAVIADPELAPAWGAAEGTPPLRRELAALLQRSDEERLVTWLGTPNFLRDDAHPWLGPWRSPLRDGLLDLVGAEAAAVALSSHLDERGWYLELRWLPPVDELPGQRIPRARSWVRGWSGRVQDYLAQVRIDPVWQPVAIRLPTWVQLLSDQTRLGDDEGGPIANAYLPAEAAANLVCGLELALQAPALPLDAPVAAANRPGENSAAPPQPQGADWLDRPLDLVVEQQSLEAVLEDLQLLVREATGNTMISIRILGADLQQEGITRNQQIRGLSLRGRPLREILTTLVLRANPVAAGAANSPAQKLVWVVEPGAGETAILVTTRTAARQKGQTLPAEFVAEP